MIWLVLIIALIMIIAIAVFIEKRGGNNLQDGDLTTEEKTQLDEDYIKKGLHHETDDPEKL